MRELNNSFLNMLRKWIRSNLLSAQVRTISLLVAVAISVTLLFGIGCTKVIRENQDSTAFLTAKELDRAVHDLRWAVTMYHSDYGNIPEFSFPCPSGQIGEYVSDIKAERGLKYDIVKTSDSTFEVLVSGTGFDLVKDQRSSAYSFEVVDQ